MKLEKNIGVNFETCGSRKYGGQTWHNEYTKCCENCDMTIYIALIERGTVEYLLGFERVRFTVVHFEDNEPRVIITMINEDSDYNTVLGVLDNVPAYEDSLFRLFDEELEWMELKVRKVPA